MKCRRQIKQKVVKLLGPSDPNLLTTEDLSSKLRTIPVEAAKTVLKTKFPSEFSVNTIDLIKQKRSMWKHLQKAGRRVTRSMRSTYNSLCQHSIFKDRNALLEKEAKELSNAFSENRFKGYNLLKQQQCRRTKAIIHPNPNSQNITVITISW